MTDKLSQVEINNLDRYIEQLLQCKPLSEVEVKNLCDKVGFKMDDHTNSFIRPRKSLWMNQTFSLFDALLQSAVISMGSFMI